MKKLIQKRRGEIVADLYSLRRKEALQALANGSPNGFLRLHIDKLYTQWVQV